MKKVLTALGFIAIMTCFVAPERKADAQIIVWGEYCCDTWGMRRCVLDDFYPIGNRCFCPGQGFGTVCG